jgi:hypothetical protein
MLQTLRVYADNKHFPKNSYVKIYETAQLTMFNVFQVKKTNVRINFVNVLSVALLILSGSLSHEINRKCTICNYLYTCVKDESGCITQEKK